uniref:PKD domain-containing protein n=1 Tax=uncultured Lutibacter sp. TaxID=437739 RepID=UPI0026044CB4
MKKITFARFFTFISMLFFSTIGFSQGTEFMDTPYLISSGSIASCSSNDVEIGRVFLGTSTGAPIGSCNDSGFDANDVYLWIDLDKASSKYGLYIEFKLLIDGIQSDLSGGSTTSLIAVKQTTVSATESKQILVANDYRVAKLPYSCGASFELLDIYISWGANSNYLPGQNNGPKCDSTVPNITVDGPLIVDFNFTKNCNEITVTTDITGGKIYGVDINDPIESPYTFTIDYGDGTTDGPYTPDLYDNVSMLFFDHVFSSYTYTTPGNYSISLHVTDTGVGDETEVKINVITIEEDLTGLSITPSATSCDGSTGSITASGTIGGDGNYSYELLYSTTSGGTYLDAANTSGDGSGIYTGLTTGFYKVVVTDGAGCSLISNYAEIIVATAPTADAGLNDSVCWDNDLNTMTLIGSATGGTAPYTYSWSGDTTYLSATNVSGPTHNNAPVGTYNLTLTVTDANGCESTDTVQLIVDSNATAEAGPVQNLCIVDGTETVQLAGSFGGGASTITWSTSGTGTFDNATSATAIYDPSAADITAGTVTLTITTDDPTGPCEAANDTVVINFSNDATAEAGPVQNLCIVDGTETVQLAGS